MERTKQAPRLSKPQLLSRMVEQCATMGSMRAHQIYNERGGVRFRDRGAPLSEGKQFLIETLEAHGRTVNRKLLDEYIETPYVLDFLLALCTEAELHELGCRMAEMVFPKQIDTTYVDKRLQQAIKAKRDWLRGKKSDAETQAAAEAAHEASREVRSPYFVAHIPIEASPALAASRAAQIWEIKIGSSAGERIDPKTNTRLIIAEAMRAMDNRTGGLPREAFHDEEFFKKQLAKILRLLLGSEPINKNFRVPSEVDAVKEGTRKRVAKISS